MSTANTRPPLNVYKISLIRHEVEYGTIVVEAENEERAKAKAVFKAEQGHVADWRVVENGVAAGEVLFPRRDGAVIARNRI